ncbi:MAG: DUF4843 domain-containing protein [Prevotellaceae bacterium]|nr:DUF4843 domain-containing protein [Prevotellaceae bacterium]
MKKFFWLTLLPLLASSCEYETLPTYSGQDQIYFAFADATTAADLTNSKVLHFGYDLPQRPSQTLSIPVKVMGSIADFSRAVSFKLDGGSAVEGLDIELMSDSSFVPAGSNNGRIMVRLLNTERLNNTTLTTALRLQQNEHFNVDYSEFYRWHQFDTVIDARLFLVSFDNAADKPNLWAAQESLFSNLFGDYSNVKLELMCQLFGLTRAYFEYDSEAENSLTIFNLRFPGALTTTWVRYLNRYLKEYADAHNGEPLRDENGNVIVTGSPGL